MVDPQSGESRGEEFDPTAVPQTIQKQPAIAGTWMIDDALDGRITMGRSKKGDVADTVQLTLPGRSVYQLQKFLECEATLGGSYFRTRWLILRLEEIRLAYKDATEVKPGPAGAA